MRKWLLAGSMVALVLVGLFCLLLPGEKGIECQVISEKKAQSIEQRLSPASDFAPFHLLFAGEKLAYDSAGKTFFLPLSMQDSMWENGQITADDGVSVFFTEDFTKRDKCSLIKDNYAIPFYAVRGQSYEICYLKLTGLPMLSFAGTDLVTESGEVLYELALYDTGGKTDWVTRCLTTSRLRGNTSLSYEKKSLRLNLKKQKKDGSITKENKNLLGLREDDDWILNSLYADDTRLRDKLALDLWQETGAYDNPYGKNFGVTGEYVEVCINDSYAGLYLLTYPVDRKQLGMEAVSAQISSGEEIVERIYKKKYTAAWKQSDFTGPLADPAMPDFRGGFFLKGDTVLGDLTEWEPLARMAACMEADDASFAETLPKITDLGNLVDNWLFFQAIGGFDNENKNVYYVARRKDGDYFGYFVPWDLNISFGAVYADNAYYCEETLREIETPVRFEPGMRAVSLNAGGAAGLAAETWEKWRTDVFSTEHVLDRAQKLHDRLTASGAMAREQQRWPDGNATEDISLLKTFISERLAFVDRYVESFLE